MGVEVIGNVGEIDGYGDAMNAFRSSHESNSSQILNLAEGRKKNATRPTYDPGHPDNAWPTMLYHAEKGEKVIGRNLKGIEDPMERKRVTKTNDEQWDEAIAAGYREEPYPKPQIAVLDPAAEKLALKAQNDELRGQIVSLTDLVNKLVARVDKTESAK